MIWFKKKTREEHIQKRTESVFLSLISDVEFEFTELETVQILNNIRRRLSEHLGEKQSEYMEHSVNSSQKAKELENVLNYVE